MGLFEKLFSSKNSTPPLAKTADLLNEEKYWSLIEASLHNTSNQDEQARYLVKEIGRLTPHEMIGFRLRTDKLLYDTYTSNMWCAGYIMNGGCSDDGFQYFRNWVISRGKEVYYQAKENPDTLVSEVVEGVDDYDFEDFWYVALDAFKKHTGKEAYDYIDYDRFTTREGNYPDIDFTWEEEDEESMQRVCPRLYDRFLNQ